MKKLNVLTLIFAIAATVAVLLMRMITYQDTEAIEPQQMMLSGLESGIAVECGRSLSDVYLSVPLSVDAKDVISVSSDTNIAYLKLIKDPIGIRVYKVEVVAVSEGIAEVYFRSDTGDYESEKYVINVIASEDSTTTASETMTETEEVTVTETEKIEATEASSEAVTITKIETEAVIITEEVVSETEIVTETEPPVTVSTTLEEGEIYVTPSGTKYHLSRKCAGKNAIEIELSDAINKGYSPCKKCAMRD